MSTLRTIFLTALAISMGAGCDQVLSPPAQAVVEEGELEVAETSDDTPPILSTEVEFWAVRGEAREVQISYEAEPPYDGKCLRFVVPPEALLRRPDGSIVEPGDSVQIAIRLLDESRFEFEFDPRGLQFDPAHPARIEIRYSWADLNDDGEANADDWALASELAIWRQEEPGQAWMKLPSTVLEEEREVHADVNGFTKYALASDRQSMPPTFNE
ncbi:MAG: hypothetical protein GEU90_16135 [Gemmatimonas sp.]|nr:hypothetical protein [Gemmatimonas sp.]